MNEIAPIVLFVYNRPWHTKMTIDALKENLLANQSDLFIYSEYPKDNTQEGKVSEVRSYLKTISGFKSITICEQKTFQGLAKSVIGGINSVLDSYEKVIVLEDDIVTSPFFLSYMNEALNRYENNKNIFSISGFNYPPQLLKIPTGYNNDVYVARRASSWGWATWKARWSKADWDVKGFDKLLSDKILQNEYTDTGADKLRMLIRQMRGEVDSWAIRWDYTHFINKAYCLYPAISFVNNIGLDGSGKHSGKSNIFFNDINKAKSKYVLPEKIEPDADMLKRFYSISKRGGKIFLIKEFFSKIFK